jgi:DNA-binding FadR family transcriptional regulator
MRQPLVKKSIVQEIIADFLHMVQTENLKQGDKIASERELSHQWQVSRTSIREAMQILAFNKVVTIKQGSGTYLNKFPSAIQKKVISIDTVDKRECSLVQRFEARLVLEPMLIKVAAKRIDENELGELKKITNNMGDFLRNGQFGGYATEDINFHSFIAKITHNRYLYDMLCLIILDAAEWYYAFGHTPNLESWSFTEHMQMYSALERHDENEAGKIMHQHIQSAFREHRKYIGVAMSENFDEDHNIFNDSGWDPCSKLKH